MIFLNGRAAVKKGGKWGYIDQTGKMVTDTDYLSTFAFTEGLAAVVVVKDETVPRRDISMTRESLSSSRSLMMPRTSPKGWPP